MYAVIGNVGDDLVIVDSHSGEPSQIVPKHEVSRIISMGVRILGVTWSSNTSLKWAKFSDLLVADAISLRKNGGYYTGGLSIKPVRHTELVRIPSVMCAVFEMSGYLFCSSDENYGYIDCTDTRNIQAYMRVHGITGGF